MLRAQGQGKCKTDRRWLSASFRRHARHILAARLAMRKADASIRFRSLRRNPGLQLAADERFVMRFPSQGLGSNRAKVL
jgi:hypothetical protein